MEIAFSSKQIRKICENEQYGRRTLGDSVYEHLKSRLADLVSAENPLELVAGTPETIDDGANPSLIVSLGGVYIMILSVNQNLIPRDSRGQMKWNRVQRLKLKSIENRNEE